MALVCQAAAARAATAVAVAAAVAAAAVAAVAVVAVAAPTAEGRAASVAGVMLSGKAGVVTLLEAPCRSRVVRRGRGGWQERCDHRSVSVAMALVGPTPTRRPGATVADGVSDDASIPTGMTTAGWCVAERFSFLFFVF